MQASDQKKPETHAHTPEPWQDTDFVKEGGKPMESAEDVMAAVASSAEGGGAFLCGATAEGYVDEAGRARVICYTGNGPTSEANSRRIVAAVNACAGIPTAALEDGVVAGLLAACRLWDEGFTDGEQFDAEQFLAWVNRNRRAARCIIALAGVPAPDPMRQLTTAEASVAYEAAPGMPLSKERIDEIVAKVTGRTA